MRPSARTSFRPGLRASEDDSGIACAREHHDPLPAGGLQEYDEIQTSVHAGGIARAWILRNWSRSRITFPLIPM